MLIVPLWEKRGWTRWPLMTACLIVLNVLVFFVQVQDGQVEFRFAEAYIQSEMPELEQPQYREWLRIAAPADARRLGAENPHAAATALWMRFDRGFQANIESLQRRALSTEDFAKWKKLREDQDAIWARHFTYRFALVPADAKLSAYLAHMFMHGGVGHLLGNMIMLALVGLLVESMVGVGGVLIIYLGGGLMAGAFHALLGGSSWVPLVGASGAISALMGAVAVLHGFRKVRFFCYFVFYFDIIALPAILVLPFWIAYEVLQWGLSKGAGNVAYMAHAGGLAGGALLALMFKPAASEKLDERAAAEDAAKDVALRDRRARDHLANAEWDAALREFSILLHHRPCADYAEQVYLITRMQPASQHYHQAARKLLALACAEAGKGDLVAKTVMDYYQKAQPVPRLEVAELARCANVLAKTGHRPEAEMIVQSLLRLVPSAVADARLAETLLAVAVSLHRADVEEERARARLYLAHIEQRFPDSEALKIGRQLLA